MKVKASVKAGGKGKIVRRKGRRYRITKTKKTPLASGKDKLRQG